MGQKNYIIFKFIFLMGLMTALFVCTRLVPSCHLHNIENSQGQNEILKLFYSDLNFSF